MNEDERRRKKVQKALKPAIKQAIKQARATIEKWDFPEGEVSRRSGDRGRLDLYAYILKCSTCERFHGYCEALSEDEVPAPFCSTRCVRKNAGLE